MAHNHDHGRASYNRAFAIGVTLNAVFVVAEAAAGLLVGSVALLADAGHNLSDVLGLLLAWGAALLATRRPTEKRTYGFRRATILASLLSAVLLLVALGAIAWEAIGRFVSPAPVSGTALILVAGIGVVVNGATALLFAAGRKRDLNIRGAYLHMMADAGVSLGVVGAGVAIGLTGWLWLDPTISLAIVLIILVGTWGLLRDSLNLTMDAVPADIDSVQVRAYLSELPGVSELHDLHIWAMSTTESALTAHLVMPEPRHDEEFLIQIERVLLDRFGIDHATIQVENAPLSHACCEVG